MKPKDLEILQDKHQEGQSTQSHQVKLIAKQVGEIHNNNIVPLNGFAKVDAGLFSPCSLNGDIELAVAASESLEADDLQSEPLEADVAPLAAASAHSGSVLSKRSNSPTLAMENNSRVGEQAESSNGHNCINGDLEENGVSDSSEPSSASRVAANKNPTPSAEGSALDATPAPSVSAPNDAAAGEKEGQESSQARASSEATSSSSAANNKHLSAATDSDQPRPRAGSMKSTLSPEAPPFQPSSAMTNRVSSAATLSSRPSASAMSSHSSSSQFPPQPSSQQQSERQVDSEQQQIYDSEGVDEPPYPSWSTEAPTMEYGNGQQAVYYAPAPGYYVDPNTGLPSGQYPVSAFNIAPPQEYYYADQGSVPAEGYAGGVVLTNPMIGQQFPYVQQMQQNMPPQYSFTQVMRPYGAPEQQAGIFYQQQMDEMANQQQQQVNLQQQQGYPVYTGVPVDPYAGQRYATTVSAAFHQQQVDQSMAYQPQPAAHLHPAPQYGQQPPTFIQATPMATVAPSYAFNTAQIVAAAANPYGSSPYASNAAGPGAVTVLNHPFQAGAQQAGTTIYAVAAPPPTQVIAAAADPSGGFPSEQLFRRDRELASLSSSSVGNQAWPAQFVGQPTIVAAPAPTGESGAVTFQQATAVGPSYILSPNIDFETVSMGLAKVTLEQQQHQSTDGDFNAAAGNQYDEQAQAGGFQYEDDGHEEQRHQRNNSGFDGPVHRERGQSQSSNRGDLPPRFQKIGKGQRPPSQNDFSGDDHFYREEENFFADAPDGQLRHPVAAFRLPRGSIGNRRHLGNAGGGGNNGRDSRNWGERLTPDGDLDQAMGGESIGVFSTSGGYHVTGDSLGHYAGPGHQFAPQQQQFPAMGMVGQQEFYNSQYGRGSANFNNARQFQEFEGGNNKGGFVQPQPGPGGFRGGRGSRQYQQGRFGQQGAAFVSGGSLLPRHRGPKPVISSSGQTDFPPNVWIPPLADVIPDSRIWGQVAPPRISDKIWEYRQKEFTTLSMQMNAEDVLIRKPEDYVPLTGRSGYAESDDPFGGPDAAGQVSYSSALRGDKKGGEEYHAVLLGEQPRQRFGDGSRRGGGRGRGAGDYYAGDNSAVASNYGSDEQQAGGGAPRGAFRGRGGGFAGDSRGGGRGGKRPRETLSLGDFVSVEVKKGGAKAAGQARTGLPASAQPEKAVPKEKSYSSARRNKKSGMRKSSDEATRKDSTATKGSSCDDDTATDSEVSSEKLRPINSYGDVREEVEQTQTLALIDPLRRSDVDAAAFSVLAKLQQKESSALDTAEKVTAEEGDPSASNRSSPTTAAGFVVGFREVVRLLGLRRLGAVLIASDVSEHGLLFASQLIVRECDLQSIPCVFTLNRALLGRFSVKRTASTDPVSCIGVLGHSDVTEEVVKQLSIAASDEALHDGYAKLFEAKRAELQEHYGEHSDSEAQQLHGIDDEISDVQPLPAEMMVAAILPRTEDVESEGAAAETEDAAADSELQGETAESKIEEGDEV